MGFFIGWVGFAIVVGVVANSRGRSGGGWRSGRRQDYRFIGEALTSRGYVVVVPDYRVYPDVRFPTFVEDGARAMSWVRSLPVMAATPIGPS